MQILLAYLDFSDKCLTNDIGIFLAQFHHLLYHAFLFEMDITDLKKRSRHTQVLGFGKFISSLFGIK